jgi:hypothetical protein
MPTPPLLTRDPTNIPGPELSFPRNTDMPISAARSYPREHPPGPTLPDGKRSISESKIPGLTRHIAALVPPSCSRYNARNPA